MKLAYLLVSVVVISCGCASRAADTASAVPPVELREVRLTGELVNGEASFRLLGVAKVTDRQGATLDLLGGRVALTAFNTDKHWRFETRDGRFQIRFDRAGEYRLDLAFRAAVTTEDGWNRVAFDLAPGPLHRIVLQGLPVDTEFEFVGAARPERSGDEFLSTLPLDGRVRLGWKEKRLEGEGRLFYAVEALSQVSVSQGLLRHTALYQFKVMQGELTEVTFAVEGEGEIIRVQGASVLAWAVEPATNDLPRRLQVRLNQPQSDQFQLVAQLQQPLGAFPVAMDPPQLRPLEATRFAGHFRVVNEGAVRLEVLRSDGLSQISPESIPGGEQLEALGLRSGTQVFAYRFSGADFQLRLQADNILPELGVSQLMVFHLGETELAIDVEIEVEVREAPLRELVLEVPRGYALARLQAAGMSDYFTSESAGGGGDLLRIVYGQPVLGRQVVQVRLERNSALGDTSWALPRVVVQRAKSVRGYLGVSADAGYRLTPSTTQGLTEIATAYFPKKIGGLQSAFRLSEADWQASMAIERLAQSIQSDTFHLFSVGEGIAYGSSVLNYLVSGAPISSLRVELSDEYFNIEFTGREIRNWRKVDGGYTVYLHTPVSGAYTLLATYERPFRSQGETLGFSGARPLDAQSEQGHTLVISDYQFQVHPRNVSPNLLPLEPGEVPAEYRLFFDAPILAAYRYTARPFNLELELVPLHQGDTLNQVVDRAVIRTRLSSEGQVVTDAQFFVKSKGSPWLRVVLPPELKLWSASVNGQPAVPVAEVNATLIPLAGQASPDAAQSVELKLAGRVLDPRRPTLTLPGVQAPILLADWTLSPEEGHRLLYQPGSLTPVDGPRDASGFSGLKTFFSGRAGIERGSRLVSAMILLFLAGAIWRKIVASGTSRWSPRWLMSAVVGVVAVLLGLTLLVRMGDDARQLAVTVEDSLHFLIPVQQAGAAPSIQVHNVEIETSLVARLAMVWPALVGGVLLLGALVRWRGGARRLAIAAAWTCLAWAALRWPNGLPVFFLLLVAFGVLQVLLPGLFSLARMPRRPGEALSTPAAAAVLAMLLWGIGSEEARADEPVTAPVVYPDSLVQDIRVEGGFAVATADLVWTARQGEVLPLLREPGVLTFVEFTGDDLEQVTMMEEDRRVAGLRALRNGRFAIRLGYHLQVGETAAGSGFKLPTQAALVHRITLRLAGMEADVLAPAAVSVERDPATSAQSTVVNLVLSPAPDAALEWRPRARDTRREESVFYAEVRQVYAPAAGVLEGVHHVLLRPAQGELHEIQCEVPAGFTIANVAADSLATWRFDPDARRLRLSFHPAQSRPFLVTVHSQLATGPLPYELPVGVLRVEGAAGQVGLLAVATGNEVQLENAEGVEVSPVNLEDFPAEALQSFPHPAVGLAVRRVFRYGDVAASLKVSAAAVEPDVRVDAQQTLSLGEDRVVLAANLGVEITRAGIFRLTFALPEGLDVESISGEALSHWTVLRSDGERQVTLHLKGKTLGQVAFALTLAGSGLRQAEGWEVPRISLREAAKQRGQLVVVPEQGMRLQVARREGVTQLDPARSGIRQKGVLVFRLLQDPWEVGLDVEQVDSWIQVTGLQDVQVGEGQIKVTASPQYEIENTGVKTLRVQLPANAEGVRFQGDQVADYLPQPAETSDPVRTWEVKLHRRILGTYLLQVSYVLTVTEGAEQVVVDGIRSTDANLQRGYLAIRADGRLQLRVDQPPPALQPSEWQSIPRRLQVDATAVPATHTFRLVEAEFSLPIGIERRDAVPLLPARVNRVTLTSVVSDAGVMLTQARLDLVPGDKRLLRLDLPAEARFWFAFVNQRGVWPWQGTNSQLLLPLEQHSRTDEATVVEFLYTLPTQAARRESLNLQVAGPRFDLPLENVTWNLYLNDRWEVTDWEGSLQLKEERPFAGANLDLQSYILNENSVQQEQIREAEKLINLGNTLLREGDPQQARRAFQAAYGLSQHDDAFNEDARVQLHNLKMQQALVGLNNRAAVVSGDAAAPALQLGGVRGQTPAYTQEQAREILDRNSAEENAVQMRLAERLVQQQEAASPSPAALRAAVPEGGRLVSFTRSLLVDPYADLSFQLRAQAPATISPTLRVAVLVGCLLGFALLLISRRMPDASSQSPNEVD